MRSLAVAACRVRKILLMLVEYNMNLELKEYRRRKRVSSLFSLSISYRKSPLPTFYVSPSSASRVVFGFLDQPCDFSKTHRLFAHSNNNRIEIRRATVSLVILYCIINMINMHHAMFVFSKISLASACLLQYSISSTRVVTKANS